MIKKLSFLLFFLQSAAVIAQLAYPNQLVSQSGSKLINNSRHFSFSIGQSFFSATTTIDTVKFNSGFQFGYSNFEERDTSLSYFVIGSIPPFSFFENEINPFYFRSNQSPDSVFLSYKLSRNIDGFVESFDSTLIISDTFYAYIRLRVPSADTLPFAITFISKHRETGAVVDSQRVDVFIQKNPPLEITQFGAGNIQIPPDILSRDYFIVVEDSSQELVYFNGIQRRVRDIEVAALEVKIDQTMAPGPDNLYARYHSNGFSTNANIRSLKIYAERVVINDSWCLPGTDVTIFAKNIIFNDRSPSTITSLSTTPYPIEINLVSGQQEGLAGTDGGDLRVFADKVQSGGKYRFILKGGNGQNGGIIAGNQIKSGEPGNGGNLTSNLQIDNSTDRIGGSSGSSGLPASRHKGTEGEFYFTGDTISWLHHNFLRIIYNYCEDLYMLGRVNEAINIISIYKLPLNEFASSQLLFPVSNGSDLQEERGEIGLNISNLWDKFDALELRIKSGIDYFGNPPGWVPLLSTEMYASNYNIQLDQAFKTLFISDLVRNANKVFLTRLNGLKELQKDLNQQFLSDNTRIEDLNIQSNDLDAQVQQNNEDLERLANELETLSKELELRAQKSIESEKRRKFWSGLCRSAGQIAKLIPDPISQGIGVGLTVVGGIIDMPPSDIKGWVEAGINGFQNVQQAVQKFEYTEQHNQTKNSFKALVNNGFCDNKEFISCASEQGKNLENVVKPFFEASKKLYDVIKSSSINAGEVADYAASLKAQDPMFRSIVEQSNRIQLQNIEFMEQIKSNINETYSLINRMSSTLISLDGLSRMVSGTNAKINLKVLQWAQNAEREAFYKLKKYHYFLAKSYEYRLCEPYPGNLNIESVFTQIKELVESAQDQNLSQDQLNVLKSAFTDAALNPILSSIIQELTNNSANQENEILYELEQEDLDLLNTEGAIIFNPIEFQGYINPGHEDIRIISIEFDTIIVKRRNQIPFKFNDNLSLTINYPKYGKIRKGGEIFNYSFYNNLSEYGIIWEGQVFPGQGYRIAPKSWGEDVELYFHMMSLIGNTQIQSQDYSKLLARPPFWADMLLRKEREQVDNLFQDSLYFTTVRLKIKYGYRMKPNNRVVINVKPNNKSLAPLFEVSKKDIHLRQEGYGEIFRTYSRNSGSITITAPESYGMYKFSRWRVNNGISNTFPTTPSVTIGTSNDGFLEAYYVLKKEQIITQDTTWFGPESSDEGGGGEDKGFYITGMGSYGTETEFNADSVYAESAGGLKFALDSEFNRGYLDSGEVKLVKLQFERNLTGSDRKLGEILTFAPGAEKFVHKTVIMQCYQNSFCETPTAIKAMESFYDKNIRIIPNPNNGTFIINLPEYYTIGHVEIMDLTGKVVYTNESINNAGFHNVNIVSLSDGIYFCRVRSGRSVFTNKFVIRK